MSMARWYGLLALAGVAATLGFAPFFVWPLGLVALAILARYVAHAPSVRGACWVALVWGMGHQLTALYWLPRAFYLDAGESVQAAVLGGVPALLGLALVGSLGVMLVAVVARMVPWAGARLPVFAVVWVALEVLKSLHPMGFPWLPVGAMWGGSVPMMQMASVVGVHGLSLIVMACAVLVASLNVMAWRVAALVVLVVLGYGVWRVQGLPETYVDGPMVRVVQPNIQSAHKWDTALRIAYLRETLDVAFGPGAVLAEAVFLPETAVVFYMGEEPSVREWVSERLLPHQALITGTVRREGVGRDALFYNSMAVVDANGVLGSLYDKQLLVPFGEYIPFRPLVDRLPLPSPVRVMSQSRLDYVAGTLSPQLQTPVGVGVGLICYEGIFPYHVARHAVGARYLVNITNDNWFTGTTALAQHATLERLRAVETGLPLVRVANTGISMVVDGHGRVVGQLPINQPSVLDVVLPPALPTTPFVGWAGGGV